VLGLGERPYLVSVGRVDDHKGSRLLWSLFAEYKRRRPGPLALAFVGPVATELPAHLDVVVAGVLDEADKADAVGDAVASVSPSALEAFSMVVPEAWAAGVPVLVNARCGATREHCERSGGGLWFGSYPEFEVVVDRLVADPALRRELAGRGRAYLDAHFRWPAITARYARFLGQVAARGKVRARRLS
jgi:glycosyltransferase involved in cell wall biosynthesis